VLVVLMGITAVLIYRKGAGLTFYFDEWNFVMNRDSWSVETFLEPHSEHLVLVPLVVFKLLFATVGLADYWVYRVVLIAVHLLCVALFFVLARRRLGDTLALIAAAPLLLLGPAWHDLLVPFQISYLGSVAAGLGSLVALDRRDRLGDAVASLLVALGLASSGVGITFAAAALLETMLLPDRLRRAWVAGAPIVLYLLWSLAYGNPTATSGGLSLTELWQMNAPAVPGHVATSLAGSFGAVIGLGVDWGRPLAALAAIYVVVRLVRGPVSTRLIALLGAAAVAWGLGGLFRAHLNAPLDSRYLYLGAVLVLLIAIELVPRLPVSRRMVAVLAVLTAAATLANFGSLRSGSLFLQEWSRFVTAELAALELAGPATDPDFVPDPTRAPDITAGKYFAAIERYDSSPAASPAEVAQRGEPERVAADAVFLGALEVKPRPVARASVPRPTVVSASGPVTRTAACARVGEPQAPASLEVAVPPRGLAIAGAEAPVEVRLRSFASGYPEAAFATVPAGTTSALRIPTRDGMVWLVRLTGLGELSACGLA
jgi:hypothetical protein